MSLRRFFARLSQIFFVKPREVEDDSEPVVDDPEDWLPEWEEEFDPEEGILIGGTALFDGIESFPDAGITDNPLWEIIDLEPACYELRALTIFEMEADHFIFYINPREKDLPDILGQSLARRLQDQFQSFQYRLREQFPYRRSVYHNYQPSRL